MHNGYWHWMMPGMGWLGILLMFLFWLLVVLALAHLARNLSPAGRETPLDILKIRYARGDIGREEFERMKKEIGPDEKGDQG